MAAKFDWQDPLNLNALLTEEEHQIFAAATQFAQHSLQPRITAANHSHTFDVAVMQEMGAQGLLGPTITGYGCAGASNVAYGLIAHAVEMVDSAYRSSLSVQSSLVMYPIAEFGNEWLRQTYLPGLAQGTKIGCFGLTEPDHGSDPGSMQTRCYKTQGGYRLTGRKSWITHAPVADVAVVWAKDEEGRIRGFVLEREDTGFTVESINGKLSLCASPTGQLIMDNVFVPDQRVLDVAGFKGPFSCLNKARYGIAWGALGAAKDCWLRAREYVMTRHQFGQPLASKQLIQKKLADMQTEISLGLFAALQVGRLMDMGQESPEMMSLIKRNSCVKALAIARDARDMLGANGIHEDYAIMRHLINLETVNTYEGTQDIHALILGRSQTGLSAF